VKAYTEATQAVVRDVPRAQRIPVHIALLAVPYNLFERIKLLTTRHGGEILDEDFAADVTLTLRFPVEEFEEFQTGLQELSAGQLIAEIMETSEMLVPTQ
ncbi:MAG: DUF1949 domain-containing protein, partial [Anaerolineales bacterium]